MLIDSYESIRNLRLEKWFHDVDVEHGIWLGRELENQSLFENIEIRDQDKKHRFNGLGFVISDGDYQVIKTVIDKDD